jgi:tRNA (cytidine/uridine-2'-O-)-methyltransferase
MRLSMFQPDIPQNLGAMMRLAACMAVPIDVIGPCGFPFSIDDPMADKNLKRVALDYAAQTDINGFSSWQAYMASFGMDSLQGPGGRLLLLTTSGDAAYNDFAYDAADVLLVGGETGGVPREVHDRADFRLCVPMAPGARSLNVVVAAAMVLGEALRQTHTLPRGSD